jgi:transaldolase
VTRLRGLQRAGVSIWIDTLSRDLLDSGDFTRLIDRGVTGATSNPTIFAKAITESDAYDPQLAALVDGGVTETQELFFALALDDVRAAADYLRPVYDRTDGRDGFVSFECTPDIAHDTSATVEQAWDLWNRLDRPNVMIKVPATSAGIPAIEELTARGVNINVTLLFALRRYDEVIDAYLCGLERRAARDLPLDHLASVASFFVSRVDTKADDELAPGSPLRGTVAVTNARQAFRLHEKRFADARWRRLAAQGARDQRPLWASTGTKNPAYSDVLYVEQLVAPGVVNTMPLATLEAFDDHGDARFPPIDTKDTADDLAGVELRAAGVDLEQITAALEREGVEVFSNSYEQLIDCIREKTRKLSPGVSGRSVAGARGDRGMHIDQPPLG